MKKQTEFSKRIAEALEYADLGPTAAARELTKRLGVKITQQRISHLLTNASGSELTQDIANLTGYKYHYLQYGIGLPTDPKSDADELAQRFDFGSSAESEFEFASKCTAKLSAGNGSITFHHEER